MESPNAHNVRAANLRDRIFKARRSVKWIAEQVGVTRSWASRVLSGYASSEELLNQIEKLLDELEHSDKYALAA